MAARQIARVGDQVLRPAHWWTSTVHALLEYLHGVGFDRVPKPIRLAEDQEVLSYIPGDSGSAGWSRVIPEQGLRAFATLLREYHDAVRGFTPPADASWALSYPVTGAEALVCHGDFGPWNVVWEGLTPVGLLDFDFAGPADPCYDVAYALEYVTPFRDDAQAKRWMAYPAPPDRRHRIEVFAEAYGLTDTDGLVDAVIDRQRLDGPHVVALATQGIEPQRSWLTDGVLDTLVERVRWSEQNRALFE